MTAKDQMIFTANALRNLAKEMRKEDSEMSEFAHRTKAKWADALMGHTDDLMEATEQNFHAESADERERCALIVDSFNVPQEYEVLRLAAERIRNPKE